MLQLKAIKYYHIILLQILFEQIIRFDFSNIV